MEVRYEGTGPLFKLISTPNYYADWQFCGLYQLLINQQRYQWIWVCTKFNASYEILHTIISFMYLYVLLVICILGNHVTTMMWKALASLGFLLQVRLSILLLKYVHWVHCCLVKLLPFTEKEIFPPVNESLAIVLIFKPTRADGLLMLLTTDNNSKAIFAAGLRNGRVLY